MKIGILTIAHGSDRYINMAINLAMSIKLLDKEIPLAIVTDKVSNKEIRRLYNFIIPVNFQYGKGIRQKFFIGDYSPFDKTMFIDSDCLVLNRIDDLWNSLDGYAFTPFSELVSDGVFDMDVKQMISKFNLGSIPRFNGGFYYFEKNAASNKFFDTAKELLDKYDEYGFFSFRGNVNEEPVFSISMAMNDLKSFPMISDGMFTPLGINGNFEISILNGTSRFIKNGKQVNPRIIHFCGAIADHFHYKRESIKVKLKYRFRFLPIYLVNAIINLPFNLFYLIFILFKRLIKVIFLKRKVNFTPLLPIYSSD